MVDYISLSVQAIRIILHINTHDACIDILYDSLSVLGSRLWFTANHLT